MPDLPPALLPRVTYQNVTAAAAYLQTAFGFKLCDDSCHYDDNGALVLAELALRGHRLMIGREGNHGQASPLSLDGANTQMLVVYVDAVDDHLQRAGEAGARIVLPLNDAPWGDRRYEALDLEGHRWAFHQRLAASAPASADA